MGTCTCGARLPTEATWCPVCLRRPVDPEQLLDELHETFRKTTWMPPPAPPPPLKRFSRWEATVFTFGPRMKIALTVPIALLVLASWAAFKPWSWFGHSDGYHPARAPAFFYLVLVSGLATAFLRILWRRARVE